MIINGTLPALALSKGNLSLVLSIFLYTYFGVATLILIEVGSGPLMWGCVQKNIKILQLPSSYFMSIMCLFVVDVVMCVSQYKGFFRVFLQFLSKKTNNRRKKNEDTPQLNNRHKRTGLVPTLMRFIQQPWVFTHTFGWDLEHHTP